MEQDDGVTSSVLFSAMQSIIVSNKVSTSLLPSILLSIYQVVRSDPIVAGTLQGALWQARDPEVSKLPVASRQFVLLSTPCTSTTVEPCAEPEVASSPSGSSRPPLLLL